MKKLGIIGCVVVLYINSLVWSANGTLPGNGTIGDPYLIEDRSDFLALSEPDNEEKYCPPGVHMNTDIASQDVKLTYGDYSVTLGAEDMYKVGKKRYFKYKFPKVSSSDTVAAMIDIEKCQFSIKISKADIGDQGTTPVFGMQFGGFSEETIIR